MKAILVVTPKHFNRGLRRDFNDLCHGKTIDGITYTVEPFLGVMASGTSISITLESDVNVFEGQTEIKLDVLSKALNEEIVFDRTKLVAYTKDFKFKSTLVFTED